MIHRLHVQRSSSSKYLIIEQIRFISYCMVENRWKQMRNSTDRPSPICTQNCTRFSTNLKFKLSRFWLHLLPSLLINYLLFHESIISNTRKVNVESMFATFYIDSSIKRRLTIIHPMNQLFRTPEKSMSKVCLLRFI